MLWIWVGISLLLLLPVSVVVLMVGLHYNIRWRYLCHVIRIFQEKPLFVVPKGQPVPGAEDIRFQTADGLTLAGCYLKTSAERRGVILFGLEFGSNRWACVQYCDQLLASGYDVFSFELRGQGDSQVQKGYDPLQWVTNHEVADMKAALAYLKSRPDADSKGIGFFGISKGGGAGLTAAVGDPWVRCCATDGVFGTYTTLVPYMRKWYGIYNPHYLLHGLIPLWFYGLIGLVGLRKIEVERHCRFDYLESSLPKLAPRPWFMIHGGGDTYIKPEMAAELFRKAREPKEIWMVEGAKHNMALHQNKVEYQRRVVEFFDKHLGGPRPQPVVPVVPPDAPEAAPQAPALAQTA